MTAARRVDRGRNASELSSLALSRKLRFVTGRLWRRMRRDVVKSVPTMTPVRMEVLSVVDRYGDITISSLAGHQGMHPSTMTRVVDGLEQRGLVVRRTADHDRRSIMVQLTEAGKSLLYDFRAEEDRFISEFLDRLTSAQRKELSRVLDVLAEFVNDE